MINFESDRGFVERYVITILSAHGKAPIDPRSKEGSGTDSPSQNIRGSGLWNVNHVDESYDPAFLDRLAGVIEATEPA